MPAPPATLRPAAQPPTLPPGATIALVAPAGPMLMERLLDHTLQPLTDAGFQTRVLRNNLGRSTLAPPYLAGPDHQRLQELHTALHDPSIDALFCVRGGYGTMRLLPHLAATPRLSPRWLIGFSDITALHAFTFHHLHWASLHAPMLFNFTLANDQTTLSTAQQDSWTHLLRTLTEGPQPLPFGTLVPARNKPLTPIEGVLLGGNLSLIAALYRTPYLPSLEGALLALEDVKEKPFRLDRMLTSLRLHGAHHQVCAVILGEFHGCGDLSCDDATAFLVDQLGDWNVPIITGAPFGHTHPQHTLTLGLTHRVDTQRHLIIPQHPDVL